MCAFLRLTRRYCNRNEESSFTWEFNLAYVIVACEFSDDGVDRRGRNRTYFCDDLVKNNLFMNVNVDEEGWTTMLTFSQGVRSYLRLMLNVCCYS